MRRIWPWLAAVSSGLLAAGALPPFDQAWLIWISLVPLLAAIFFGGTGAVPSPKSAGLFQSPDDTAVVSPGYSGGTGAVPSRSRFRWLRDFALGYVAGLTFFSICFFWITTVTGLGWFLLAFYMALYFAVWAWFCGLMRPPAVEKISPRDKWNKMLAQSKPPPAASASPWLSSGRNLLSAFCLAAAWVAMEWTRGWLLSGFGWNGLGVALHATWPMIQIAEFTGVAGISFFIAFCNCILFCTGCRLWRESRLRAMRPHYDLTLTMVALIGIFSFGLSAANNRPATRPLRVALVQASVPRAEKFDLRYKQSIFDKFAQLSEIALIASPKTDLLVWPESAMPAPVLEDQETFDFVNDLAAAKHLDLLLGVIDEPPGGGAYNAALLIAPDTKPQLYRKIHLVPFGEYVPFRHSFPLFANIVGDQVPDDFDAGHDYTLFQLSNNRGRVAPLVCFEDTLGDLTRHFVLNGADLLVNVTNDGWFQHSVASRQQLASAVFRCVENRRPMVRAANTGVTCFVNTFGRVTQLLRDDRGSIFEEGTLVGEVNLAISPTLTFYTRHGELFAELCGGITILIIIFQLVRRLRR